LVVLDTVGVVVKVVVAVGRVCVVVVVVVIECGRSDTLA
jgi:hypothetical protein